MMENQVKWKIEEKEDGFYIKVWDGKKEKIFFQAASTLKGLTSHMNSLTQDQLKSFLK